MPDRLPVNLAPIIRRANAATPGPWTARTGYPQTVFQQGDTEVRESTCIVSTSIAGAPDADAEFIAAARTDVPALVSEVADLLDVLHRVQAVLADWRTARRAMSDGHPMAQLLDRLDSALAVPAQTTQEGEDRG